MPWQVTALRYMTALGRDGTWLYPEFASIVSRQNGKTTLLVPVIVKRLREGRRMMHTAQNRELPREVFGMVADVMEDKYLGELRRRPRFANGQEEILTRNGGRYRIVAPTRGGARGPSNDDVIVDELREMNDFDFIGAAEPTLTASSNPQMIYLSNAGTDDSAVLNALRLRSGDDPSLAYLEWSAAPERSAADRTGWLESNPAIGHEGGANYEYLERKYQSYLLSGELGIFETEHLCRWVHAVLPPIIRVETWEALRADVDPPRRPALGLSLDPAGRRASAVLAWQQDDGRVATRLLADEAGDPLDVPAFGERVRVLARAARVGRVAYDGATDVELAKYFRSPESVSGSKFTNASSRFVNAVEGHGLVWDGEPVTSDVEWTGRHTHPVPGTWTAVPLSDEHPVTGLLATIRAVWLASGPRPVRGRVM